MKDPTTLDELQRLNDGFHSLADDVLRHMDVELRRLKPNGINAEGKPVPGTPDSYVGSSAAGCEIAIEYTTTKADALARKFEDDYAAVVRKCAQAKRIILCTNRREKKKAAEAVVARAKRDGRDVEIVWGEEIARILDDERQDLRQKHLGIPLRALTPYSLVPALQAQVLRSVSTCLGPEGSKALQGRLHRRSVEAQFRALRPSKRSGITLVVGDAGQGKTTWSAAAAMDASQMGPTAWSPMRALASNDINSRIVGAIFGTQDQSRVDELALLLRTTRRNLLVFLDAIDEHADYGHVQQALQTFVANSPLAENTHIVLTCRSEAIRAFESLHPNALPAASGDSASRRIYLDRLHEDESRHLLGRLGASADDVVVLKRTLPADFYGNPFYLKLARRLQRERSLPQQDVNWIGAFAGSYINDILRRSQATSRPSSAIIQSLLGSLALLVLDQPQGVDPSRLNISPHIVPGITGEDTLLERAAQSGLLVPSGERLQFCHALLCEYFAADRICTDPSRAAADKVQAIARLPGRASIARFAMLREPELIRHFVRAHPVLVESFKASDLDASTHAGLIEQAAELLRSDYPSERLAAVRVLGTLSTPEAAQTAVKWFNALDQRRKVERIEDAAELFLQLELPGAVRVVGFHRWFRILREIPWYEPDFARRIDGLSTAFRRLLADDASGQLDGPEGGGAEEARLTTILAYLRDPRLLARLRAKAQQAPLAKHEHRALLHFNTDEAMSIYLASRERHYARIDEIEPDKDRQNVVRAQLWRDLVLGQGDIARFPHDAVVRLARQELQKQDWNDVSFGLALANTLQHDELVEEYAEAVARRRHHGFTFGDDMIGKLVTRLDGEGVVALYEKVSSVEARRAILQAAGDVPSEQVEDLLLRALEDEALFDSACVGVTRLRSARAGPLLRERLGTASGYRRERVIKALGRVRHEPALGDLIELLEVIPISPRTDDLTLADDEDALICAIGEIGGPRAYKALAARAGGPAAELVLGYLLDSHDPRALAAVHDILRSVPGTERRIGPALCHRDLLHDDTVYAREDSFRVEFSDPTILRALLESARAQLLEPKALLGMGSGLWNDTRAIGLFGCTDAELFLSELADREADHERSDLWLAVRHARAVLAARGHRRWIVAAVEGELDDVAQRPGFREHDRDRLRRWPAAIVREALISRIESNSTRTGTWLYFLLPFATAADAALVRAHLPSAGIIIADIIQQQLPALD